MSILSRNLKLIRREVKCTQAEMAKALGIGFRTYVRYERGERDAPAATLIRISKVGNVSLQKLLTRELTKHDISPGLASPQAPLPLLKSIRASEGAILFQKSTAKCLIATNESERKLLAGFRKLNGLGQKDFIRQMKQEFKIGSRNKSAGKNVLSSSLVVSAPQKELVLAASIKPGRIKKKGQSGRKTLDRKTLREKINRLKSVSRSAPKVTVG